MVPEPSNCNPTFDSAPDLPFVPFEGSFDEQLDAYTDPCDNKEAYVLSRGGNEALMTPIKIPLPATKELTPIRVDSDQLNSLLDPVVRFARPLRPTVARNIGNTLHANRLFFRHIENKETAMDKSAMDAYIRILHNSPNFVGLRPEKKEDPFTVLGVFFYDLVSDMFIRNEGRNDPEHDRDSTDHLTEDMCGPLLDLVRGQHNTRVGWEKIVPWNEIDKNIGLRSLLI
ncbi:hypothetical protein CASFOL_001005 [Castilleja foliolosa]|uniref:Uncharacterized protein n=1 Tax=Castilleja foliolosa TaxID=1961234 RepID=A0ABD3EQ52_9LAMI